MSIILAKRETRWRKVNLLGKKKRKLAINLSYGQRKLLEIARAVSTRAETYLLWTSRLLGLFPEIIKTVLGIIKELKEKAKPLFLLNTIWI